MADTTQTGISVIMERYIRSMLENNPSPKDFHSKIMAQAEKPLLKVALEQTNGNQLKAAELLGINRNTMNKKVKLYRLSNKGERK